jgi:hypothetical protein
LSKVPLLEVVSFEVEVVLATSKVPLLETVPFEIKVPLTESKVPLLEAVLFEIEVPLTEIKVPLAETKVPLAKSIVPLFEIGVLLSERKLVWVVTSGAPTIVWLTYLMVPYTLAVDKHGIFTTTLVLFLPAHSGAVLLTHEMVLFVQLTVLLLESVQLTRLAAATTHINLPSLVQSDVVLAGHTPVVSPTQPTIAFCSIF